MAISEAVEERAHGVKRGIHTDTHAKMSAGRAVVRAELEAQRRPKIRAFTIGKENDEGEGGGEVEVPLPEAAKPQKPEISQIVQFKPEDTNDPPTPAFDPTEAHDQMPARKTRTVIFETEFMDMRIACYEVIMNRKIQTLTLVMPPEPMNVPKAGVAGTIELDGDVLYCKCTGLHTDLPSFGISFNVFTFKTREQIDDEQNGTNGTQSES